MFTNVEERGVFSLVDVPYVYQIPLELHKQGLDELIVEKLKLKAKPADLSDWQRVLDSLQHPESEVKIAMVGKYIDLADSYKSLTEALVHAGINTKTKVNVDYVDAEELVTKGVDMLASYDAILVPGGFGERGVEGKILAAQYAREHKVPYLGICLGLQTAVIEYARHMAGIKQAYSTEFDTHAKDPVVALVTEWVTTDGGKETRGQHADKGGTMRLGEQQCNLIPNSLAARIYGCDEIFERHRHRYEVNDNYVKQLTDAGLIVSGHSINNNLVEMIELKDHPWFLGCQFHPEFKSTPRTGHPLFISFINAAKGVNDYQHVNHTTQKVTS